MTLAPHVIAEDDFAGNRERLKAKRPADALALIGLEGNQKAINVPFAYLKMQLPPASAFDARDAGHAGNVGGRCRGQDGGRTEEVEGSRLQDPQISRQLFHKR